MRPDDHIATKSVLLNKELVEGRRILPRSHWIQSHNPRIMVEEALDEVIVKVEAEVFAGDPVTITNSVYYPASWWDHFKKDVLVPLTRNPSTRLGTRLYHWAWNWERKREFFTDTINRKVCPHLDVPPYPGEFRTAHVEWLTSLY